MSQASPFSAFIWSNFSLIFFGEKTVSLLLLCIKFWMYVLVEMEFISWDMVNSSILDWNGKRDCVFFKQRRIPSKAAGLGIFFLFQLTRRNNHHIRTTGQYIIPPHRNWYIPQSVENPTPMTFKLWDARPQVQFVFFPFGSFFLNTHGKMLMSFLS